MTWAALVVSILAFLASLPSVAQWLRQGVRPFKIDDPDGYHYTLGG